MQLHELKAPRGARKRKRIVGRGNGSGRGKTSGRGENGQGSREGRGILRNLEGGQMPLIRRIPKVGFRSHRPILYQVVNLEELSRFKEGTVVDAKLLKSHSLINSLAKPYKILGNGELKKALTIRTYSVSKTAEEKIKKAGGKIEKITRKTLHDEKKNAKKDETSAKKDKNKENST